MMKGYLRSKGIQVAERRVGVSLERVAPYYHRNRAQGTQNQLNPQQYHAPYFGYNLHMDQNEKLVDFGVVFVIGVDGLSGHICGASVMPRKNNVTIYSQVYSPAVTSYGMWDSLLCDHGREFYLVEFIQHYLSNYRIRPNGNLSQREPYKQMTSTKNNRVERLWGEINKRVGYPLKYALLDLEDRQLADRTIQTHLFAISKVSMLVAQLGLQRCISAWNNHPVPHSGIPSNYVAGRQNYQLPQGALPTEDQAVQMYRASGGQLTDEYSIGEDLLSTLPQLQAERENLFQTVLTASGGVDGIFGHVSNHNYASLHNAIQQFMSITQQLNNRRQ